MLPPFFIQSGDSALCLVCSEHTFYSRATSASFRETLASFRETLVLNKSIDPYKELPFFFKVLNILLGRQDRLPKGSTLSCFQADLPFSANPQQALCLQ